MSLAVAAFVATATALADDAALPRVERVEILQNRLIPSESLRYYVSTKAGDVYDLTLLREDFRRLWKTGFLEDLVLDVRDGATGKIVAFVVSERKRVQIVDYRGSKAVSTGDIDDALKKKEAAIRTDTFYDVAATRKAEAAIQALLRDKGRPFATVRHDVKPLGPSGAQLSFVIDDGPQARVKKIDFTGNAAVSDRRLRKAMKTMRERRLRNLSWILGKTTYTEEKWREAQENLRSFYLDRGHVEATVGEPTVTYYAEREGGPKSSIAIEIPVTEGPVYRVGNVDFEGLTAFPTEAIRPLFKLRPGEVYDDSKLQKGYEKLREVYGSRGYFQWTGLTKRKPDPERRVVDLVLAMEEDERYFVGRIRFTGNETTRDTVVRREVFLNEGEVFNTEALKLSIRRLNQLGYFKPIEAAPEIAPATGTPNHLDVTFKVEEQSRNQFNLGGGFSGLEGTFVNASFATTNFLGRGESLQLTAQTGSLTRQYQVAFTQPYFLERPITVGTDLFSRRLTYRTETDEGVQGYRDARVGGQVTTGFPVGTWTRLNAAYSYQVVDVVVTKDVEGLDNAALVDSVFLQDEGRRNESTLAPGLVRSTVDNPTAPRRGTRVALSLPLTGGPLQGSLDLVKPNLELVAYLPHTSRTALGLRGELGWVVPFSDTARRDPTTHRTQVPFYQRFFIGGETQVRGYDVRTLGPRDAAGRAVGGTRFLLLNAEYYLDFFPPLRLLLFHDAGQAYGEGQAFNLKQLQTSSGVEARFSLPVLNVPFRLIYAVNGNKQRHQPRTAFRFALGTMF